MKRLLAALLAAAGAVSATAGLALLGANANANANERVDNFVLLDHTGKAQELYYQSDASAVVILIQDNNCPAVHDSLATFAALQQDYQSRGVRFWMLNLEVESKTRADASGRETLTRTYYDGDAFVGLPLGQATRGDVSRSVEGADDAGAVVETARARYDAHGNVVEEINPNGSLAGGHRQHVTYSADGLDVVSESVEVTGPDGEYLLQRDYAYDPLFAALADASARSLAK